jgi:hypothetical protein
MNPTTDTAIMADMYPLILHTYLFQYNSSVESHHYRTCGIGFRAEINAYLGFNDDRVSDPGQRYLDPAGIILEISDLQPISFLAYDLEGVSFKEFKVNGVIGARAGSDIDIILCDADKVCRPG